MGKGGVEPSPRPEATPTHLPMAPRPEEDAKSTSSKASKNSLSSLNLNTFLANYTSEDNQSFQEILENSDKKHKIKVRDIYLLKSDLNLKIIIHFKLFAVFLGIWQGTRTFRKVCDIQRPSFH